MPPPAVHLHNDQIRLTLLPDLGCRWTRLEVLTHDGWKELLASGENLDDPLFGGCFLMAPWCNRIDNASFTFDGALYGLKPNFPDQSAIHGDVYRRAWNVFQENDLTLSAALDAREVPDFNYPFPLSFRYDLTLDGPKLIAAVSMTNVGAKPAPVGFGFHPFFLHEIGGRFARIKIPAEHIVPTKDALPSGPSEPVTTQNDLRRGVAVNNGEIDALYTRIRGDVEIEYAGIIRVLMNLGDGVDYAMVYAPALHQKKIAKFMCVEPQTMMNNGFNLAEQDWGTTGLRVVAPGKSWGSAVTFSFER